MTHAPRRRDHTLLEEVPDTGEVVLFQPDTGKVLALNPTGAAVWELLDGERTPEALAALIAEAIPGGAPPEQVARDVSALLDQLAQEGFLA